MRRNLLQDLWTPTYTSVHQFKQICLSFLLGDQNSESQFLQQTLLHLINTGSLFSQSSLHNNDLNVLNENYEALVELLTRLLAPTLTENEIISIITKIMPKFDEFHNNVNYFTACSNVITPSLYKQLLYCKIAKITLYLILKNNIEGDWKNNGQPWSESFYWPEEIKISFNAYLQASREIQTMLKISTKTLFENPMRPSEQGQFLLDLSLPSLSLFEKNYLMVDINNLIFTFFTARIAAIKKYINVE